MLVKCRCGRWTNYGMMCAGCRDDYGCNPSTEEPIEEELLEEMEYEDEDVDDEE